MKLVKKWKTKRVLLKNSHNITKFLTEFIIELSDILKMKNCRKISKVQVKC